MICGTFSTFLARITKMSPERSLLERILIRFSYTTKVKFILFCGYLPPFLLLTMNYILILGPLKSLDKQTSGTEFLNKSGLVFEQIVNYLRIDPSVAGNQRRNLESNVDEKLYQLKVQGHQWIEKLSGQKQELILDQFGFKLDLFSEFWTQIKKDHANIQAGMDSGKTIEGFLEAYRILVNQISIVTDLQFNFDGETSYLINSLVKDLPATQIGVLNIMLKEQAQSSDIQNEAALILLKNDLIISAGQLFTDGKTALLEVLQQNGIPQEEDLKNELGEYKLEVMKFASLIDEIKPAHKDRGAEFIETGNKALDRSFELNHKMEKVLQKTIVLQTYRIRVMIWGGVLILLLGGSLVAIIYFSRVMRHPLENLANAAQELSKGNLGVRVPITTKDEVGKVTAAFNEMAGYYESVLRKATAIIDRLFATSTTISSFAKGLETNVNREERTVKQIASNARSIQRTVEEFTDILQKAYQGAVFTSSSAETGRSNLHEMESIMHEMLSSSSNVVTTLSALREKLVNINKVILTIVQIADQSNLLSLNTVIRATKTGSEGRGFVVIADKIREMADQIAYATLDIEKVVQEIVGAVQATVQHVDNFSGQIRKQVQETTEISNQLKNLIDTTQEQIRDFEKINAGMQRQNQGILEINTAIEELKISSQESAYSVRKLYLEIEYLHESSQHLQERTRQFTFSPQKDEKSMKYEV